MLASGGRWEGGHLSKGQPSHHWQSVGKELLQTEGRHYAETAQSALTITFTLTFGGLNSIILIVLSTVNFQLQGLFAPISLRPVLRILATCHGYTLVII